MGFPALTMALMGYRQALTLSSALSMEVAKIPPATTELPGLAVSILGLLAIIFLEHLLVQHHDEHEALRESEARYHQLFDVSPDALFILDASGNFLDCNPVAEKHYGYSRQEFMQMKVRDLAAPDLRDQAAERVKRALDSGMTFEWRHLCKDGTQIPVEIGAAPISLAGQQGILASVRSISERVQADEKLRRSEELFSNAFHTSPAGKTITRIKDGKFIDANEAFLQMFEFSRDEVIGHTSTELNMWTPEERKKLIAEQIRSGGLQNFELEARAKSGQIVNILFSSKSLEFLGETHHITTMIDITERVQAEKGLRESEALYHELFEAESDSIFLIENATGRIHEANSAAAALYGYASDELLTLRDVDLAAEPETIRKSTNGPTVTDGQAVYLPVRYHRKKDGTVFPVEITGRVFNRHGNLFRVAAIRDITERLQAEKLLLESEERLRLSTELANVAVWEYSFLSNSMTRSKNHDQLYGLEWQSSWEFGTFLNATHPDDREYSNAIIQKSAAPGGPDQYQFDFRVVYPDQSIHWLAVIGQVVERDTSSQGTLARGTLIDITERKQAEEALRENEALLRTIAENYPNSFLSIIEKNLTIGFTSGQEFKKQNLDPDQFIGMTLEQVFGDHAPVVREHYLKTFAGEEQSFEFFINEQHQFYRTVPLYAQDGTIPRVLSVAENITERKKTENERQKFVMLADSSSEFIGMCDLDFNPLYVNPAGVRMVGLPDMDAACRVKVQDYFFPEDQQFITEEFFPQVLRDGYGDVDIRLRHFQTGEEIWMFYYLYSVREASGKIIGWATVSRDITERKLADAALRESEERFRAISSHTPDHILMQDRQLRYTLVVNPQLGLTEDDMLGKTDYDFLTKEDADHLTQFKTQVIVAGEPANFETSLNSTDGEPEYFEGTYVPRRDASEQVIGLIGYFRNVTERKQAEQALHESEFRYRQLLEASPIGVGVHIDGKIAFLNPAGAKILGAESPGNLIGKPINEIIHPDGIKAAVHRIQRMLAGGQGLYPVEDRFIRLDGSVIPVEVMAVPLTYKGQPAVQVMVMDISERKEAEKALRNSYDQLRSLATRISQVEETERRNIARELHDSVGQNLTALSININMLRSISPRESVETFTPFLDDSQKLIEHTSGQIRNIMAELRPPELDDYGLVAALRWYAGGFAARNQIETQLPSDDLDPRPSGQVEIALFRIAQEALTNIAKHAQASQVVINLSQGAGILRMTIADDGIGFNPLAQISDRGRKSWGLLNLKERAESIGGQMQIESQLGSGTRLTVEVPR